MSDIFSMLSGLTSFIMIAVFVFIVFMVFKVRSTKNGMVFMSLRKFEINTDPEAEYVIVIEGRKTGLLAWILVKLNLGNIYQLQVSRDDIKYLAESLSGKSHSLVPVHRIASTSCGYEKPIWWLIFGFIFILISPVAYFLPLILAALCFIIYVYQKNFFIQIETIGSTNFGFAFKRSFIENKPIDIDKIETAIALINDMVKANK